MTFATLSTYFSKLEQTSSRLTMTEILADLFRKATPDEIDKICYLLQGRVAPLYDPIEFGIADKFMIRAIAIAYTTDQAKVLAEFKRSGDLGKTAETIAKNNKGDRGHSGDKGNRKIGEIFELLTEIAQTQGTGSQDKKIIRLAELLSTVDPLSSRYLVRIPLDKLRLGFSDMTILDAFSWMLGGDKSLRGKLEEAYNVRPDIGYIAQTMKEKGIHGLSRIRANVGVPIIPALCQRIPTADEMVEKMGTVAVEPKYDGMRVQIHYQTSHVKSFSRNLENTTAMFPELLSIGKQIEADEVIFDSEAVCFDKQTGKILPFQETTTRKRKHQVDLFSQTSPIRFYVFDILSKNGKDLLALSLKTRRGILEKTLKKGMILEISPQIITDNPDKLRKFHDQQLRNGLEGAVVKRWDSPYTPGRRNFSWVKFKEEEGESGKLTDTIDGVVMGYTSGEGKRTAFGIGQVLLGVRDGDNFVTITKLGTGLTEGELSSLFETLKEYRVKSQPKEYINIHKVYTPDVWVDPRIVLEIAGDDLTKSPTHGAGIAVRFPRLVRIRKDKGPREITTVQEIEHMYANQGGNRE